MAQRHQEHQVQREVAEQRGQRERQPAVPEEPDGVEAELDGAPVPIAKRLPAEPAAEPVDDLAKEPTNGPSQAVALEHQPQQDHRRNQHSDPDHGRGEAGRGDVAFQSK